MFYTKLRKIKNIYNIDKKIFNNYLYVSISSSCNTIIDNKVSLTVYQKFIINL